MATRVIPTNDLRLMGTSSRSSYRAESRSEWLKMTSPPVCLPWDQLGLRQLRAPRVEVAIDELRDISAVRIDLEEDADPAGVVLPTEHVRLEQRVVARHDAVVA